MNKITFTNMLEQARSHWEEALSQLDERGLDSLANLYGKLIRALPGSPACPSSMGRTLDSGESTIEIETSAQRP